jgi:hypothetical protein
MPVSGLVRAASRPHSAVSAARVRFLLAPHAESTRATTSSGASSSRYVAISGLNVPIEVITQNWTAMTMTSPVTPGRMSAIPSGKHAPSVPETARTGRRPNRAASGEAIREPTIPPMHGTANASEYCQGANPNWPSIRTAISGSVARIRPPVRTEFRNRNRSTGCRRMYRHPTEISDMRARSPPPPSATASDGRGSRAPPIAVMPSADSR